MATEGAVAAGVSPGIPAVVAVADCGFALITYIYHKRLVCLDRPFVIEKGRVRDPVKRLVLIKDRDRSVSLIRTLPLAVKETRTVTGATKPAAQGQCRLGQLALQAGVI